MSLFSLVLKQTISLSFRRGGGAFGTLAFYIILATLFTFAFGPQAMQHFGGSAMCLALLLAIVTSLPQFFERDYEDGTLEQYILQPLLLEWIVLAKILGHFIATMTPILLVTPLIAIMSGLDAAHMQESVLLLVLASPTLCAIGAVAAALTLGSRRGGLLQALVIMPFYIPVLIFAATAGQGAWWFLSGLLFASLPLSCLATAALIRISSD